MGQRVCQPQPVIAGTTGFVFPNARRTGFREGVVLRVLEPIREVAIQVE